MLYNRCQTHWLKVFLLKKLGLINTMKKKVRKSLLKTGFACVELGPGSLLGPLVYEQSLHLSPVFQHGLSGVPLLA